MKWIKWIHFKDLVAILDLIMGWFYAQEYDRKLHMKCLIDYMWGKLNGRIGYVKNKYFLQNN